MNPMKTLLRIDSSARISDSITRQLGNAYQDRWQVKHPEGRVIYRDLTAPLPQISADWVDANLTDPSARTDAQHAELALSDQLIAELKAADALLVTVPMYNFSVPAALKSWIDLICRARETFAYTEQGPQGLLSDRPVTLVLASGGVPMGSAVDYMSDYLRHIFGFIGLHDVRRVAAECLSLDAQAGRSAAESQLNRLFDHPDRAA